MPIYAIRNCKSTGNWASHRGPHSSHCPTSQSTGPLLLGAKVAILSARKGHWQNFSFQCSREWVVMVSWTQVACAFIDLRQGRQAAPPTMWSTSDELLCQSSEQTFQNETHVDLCGPSESPLSLESDLWLLKSILGYWNFIASQYVPFDVPAQKPFETMISGRVCMDIICWYRWTASTDGIQYREIQILTLEDNSRPSLDSTITMRRATASCEGFRFVKTSLFLDLNRCATCSSCSWNRNCETRISNYTQPELLQNSYSGKSRAAGRNGIQPQESPLFRPAPMCPPQIHRKFIRN